jgi:hypothetical protein
VCFAHRFTSILAALTTKLSMPRPINKRCSHQPSRPASSRIGPWPGLEVATLLGPVCAVKCGSGVAGVHTVEAGAVPAPWRADHVKLSRVGGQSVVVAKWPQIAWRPAHAHGLLQVRTAVLNGNCNPSSRDGIRQPRPTITFTLVRRKTPALPRSPKYQRVGRLLQQCAMCCSCRRKWASAASSDRSG